MSAKELPKGNDEEQPPQKRRSKFKIIMLTGSLLLVLGASVGAGYWWLYLRPDAPGLAGLFSSETVPTTADNEGETAGGTAGGNAAGSAGRSNANEGVKTEPSKNTTGNPSGKIALRPVPLPSLTVNLADPPGNRYLKIGMEVEVTDKEAISELQNQNARVRDAIILLLSSKTVKDLTSPEGKVLLKNEVASRLNQILGSSRIIRIFFTNFVIE